MSNEPIALTVKQAAELLQVGEDAVYDLVHRADFPSFRVGRSIRIDRRKLEAWTAKQSEEALL